MQLEHYNSPFQEKIFPIIILCDHISSEANIGSIFRLADAFGVSKVVFGGITPKFSRRMEKTARNTHKTVPHKLTEDILQYALDLKKKGFTILALEITKDSIPIQNIEAIPDQNMALILGNENAGISDGLIKIADYTCHIEMFGKNSSMNVAQSAGICLYELTKNK
ncbi:TrmH family RNA methyltransferase [Galbibacter mesophilus]|uniref:TrmH family RNA methyltransferase n=1 Tax=Galbibacter mesophilus TaxID=379069 RepID=UPI00191CD947|nr:TrmH family RNA methyltransferase [Galbibacter mesophilus]MCM5663103.1 TrmH family RNA methyltransferase [Galbibacter mesophilus]